jgi:hypothetical protein
VDRQRLIRCNTCEVTVKVVADTLRRAFWLATRKFSLFRSHVLNTFLDEGIIREDLQSYTVKTMKCLEIKNRIERGDLNDLGSIV